MISHPGNIQARFGRYEGVERLGTLERGELWRAWDPFLERYVTVVSLTGMDAAEIHGQVPTLEEELPGWLGPWHHAGARVLDFGPAGPSSTAFVVIDLSRPDAHSDPPSSDDPVTASTGDGAPHPPWQLVVVAAGCTVLGAVIGWLAA